MERLEELAKNDLVIRHYLKEVITGSLPMQEALIRIIVAQNHSIASFKSELDSANNRSGYN